MSTEHRDPVDLLAEGIIQDIHAGEDPDLLRYAQAFPELADQLPEIIAAIKALEHWKAPKQLGDESTHQDADDDEALSRPIIRGYRLLNVIGSGGMGVVYEAEHEALRRTVALKVLPAALWQDAGNRDRFRQESRAASKLNHPHIVPVYEMGESNGVGYYTMALIRGPGMDLVWQELRRNEKQPAYISAESTSELKARIRSWLASHRLLDAADRVGATPPHATTAATARRGPSSPSTERSFHQRNDLFFLKIARLGAQLADALAHAHAEGVLHRDIKPSNILLDSQGNGWLTDFGLAKIVGDISLTQTGNIVGTLRFMAPERLEGWNDARGDIYSLGVTLYELLSGEPIYSATVRSHLIEQIFRGEPTPLRRVDRSIPKDLETIVRKAIAKDPSERYASARALADDLERFQQGQLIQARRPNFVERTYRWYRRNRPIAYLGIVSLACLLSIIGVLATSNRSIQDINSSLRKAIGERDSALRQAKQQERLAISSDANSRRVASLVATERGLLAGEDEDFPRAALWLDQASRLMDTDSPSLATAKHRYVAHAGAAPQPAGVFHHAHSFDGWVNRLEFQPNGHWLVSRADSLDRKQSEIRVWDLDGNRALDSLPVATASAWSADGTYLTLGTADGRILLTAVPFTSVPVEIARVQRPIIELAISPAGEWIAAATATDIRIARRRHVEATSDGANSTAPGPLFEMMLPVTTTAKPCWVDFSADERHLVVALDDNSLICYQWSTDLVAVAGSAPSVTWTVAPVYVPAVDWSPTEHGKPRLINGGKHVLYITPSQPRVGMYVAIEDGSQGKFINNPGLALDIDRSETLLGDSDLEGEIIELGVSGKERGRFHNSKSQLTSSLHFRADSTSLVTGAGDRRVRILDTRDATSVHQPLELSRAVSCVRTTEDGQLFAAAVGGGSIHVWRFANSGVPISTGWLPTQPNRTSQSTLTRTFSRLSPDGKYVVAVGGSNRGNELKTVRVWELPQFRDVGVELSPGGIILDGAFGHRDGWLAFLVSPRLAWHERSETANDKGRLQLVQWQDGQLGPSREFSSEPRAIACHPQRSEFAVLCSDGSVHIVSETTAEVLNTWQAHAPRYNANFYINNGELRYSPDGTQLVVYGSDEPVARVFDPSTGKLLFEVRHGKRVDGVRYSHSGKWLATAGWGDNRVKVVDTATGTLSSADMPHPDWTFSVDFDPEERRIVTSCRDGMVRMWDWRTGDIATVPLNHPHEVHDARFVQEGRWVLTVCDNGTARLWDAATGIAVSPPLAIGGAPGDMALTILLSHDQSTAIIGGLKLRLSSLALDPATWPSAERLAQPRAFAELLSGKVLRDGSESPLSTDDILARWKEVSSVQSAQRLPSSLDNRRTWHIDTIRQEMMRAPSFATVRWHLNQLWDIDRTSPAGVVLHLHSLSNMLPADVRIIDNQPIRNEFLTAVNRCVASVSIDLLAQHSDTTAVARALDFLVTGTQCSREAAQNVVAVIERLPHTAVLHRRTRDELLALAKLRANDAAGAIEIIQSMQAMIPSSTQLLTESLARLQLGDTTAAREALHMGWMNRASSGLNDAQYHLIQETTAEFDRIGAAVQLTRRMPNPEVIFSPETIARWMPLAAHSANDYRQQARLWLMAGQWLKSAELFQIAHRSEPLQGRDEIDLLLASRLASQSQTYHEHLQRLQARLQSQASGFLAGIWVSLLDEDLANTAPWSLDRTQSLAGEAKHLEFQLPLAFILLRFGRPNDGLERFEQLETLIKERRSDPDGLDPVRFTHLEFVQVGKALCYWRLGKLDESQKLLELVEASLAADDAHLADRRSPLPISLEENLILQQLVLELHRHLAPATGATTSFLPTARIMALPFFRGTYDWRASVGRPGQLAAQSSIGPAVGQ